MYKIGLSRFVSYVRPKMKRMGEVGLMLVSLESQYQISYNTCTLKFFRYVERFTHKPTEYTE